MKAIHYEGSFRRDYKRIMRRGWDIAKLESVVDLVRRGIALPPAARPHPLKGEWLPWWECHVANDWLLVYEVTDTEIRLFRTGAHADLFE